MKRISLAAVLGALAITASAQVVVVNHTLNQPIDRLSGNSDTITLPSSSFTPGAMVTDVNVLLNLAGNPIMYNSDFVAYLAHGSQLAYLINRVGWTSTSGSGYGDNGMDVKFDDAQGASRDIHLYGTVLNPGDPVIGTWSSDGRAAYVDARSLNPNPLATFNGSDPSGDWRLYVQDALSGANSSATLVSWGVEITAAVPEPSEYAMVFGLALLGFAAYRRYTVKTA